MPDKDAFIITHAEFLTLIMVENGLVNSKRDGAGNAVASSADIREAERIARVRHHPKRVIDYSEYFAARHQERVELKAAAMRPRILRLKEAFEAGDHAACRRQEAKERKGLLSEARDVVGRVEARIGPIPQTAG